MKFPELFSICYSVKRGMNHHGSHTQSFGLIETHAETGAMVFLNLKSSHMIVIHESMLGVYVNHKHVFPVCLESRTCRRSA